MSQCFGVKIILQDKDNPVVEDTNIGLYNVADNNSEFRWIQNVLTGLSGWKTGMIIANGLSKFSIEIDLRLGGNISYPGNGSVTVKNINKFNTICESKDIHFAGLKLEIWYFNYDNNHSDQKRLRTYVCNEPTFTNSEFIISFKGGQEKRISNILNVVSSIQFPDSSSNTIGKVIPASFGRLIPKINNVTDKVERGSLAKFIRVNDRVEPKYYTDTFFTGSEYVDTYSFPISDIPLGGLPLQYDCDFRGTASGSDTLTPDDTYVKVIDGTGKDQIRKIEWFSWTSTTLTFKIIDYFETELSDSDISEDGRSWVQFIKISRDYYCDHWRCEGFFDHDAVSCDNHPELYTYDANDGISRIAPYGYIIDELTDMHNRMEMDPKLFDQGDLDTQNSFLILPVKNIKFADTSDLSDWNTDTEVYHRVDGLYSDVSFTYDDNDFSDADHTVDKISTSYATEYFTASLFEEGVIIYKAIIFDLPQIPSGFTFSNFYIGLKVIEDLEGTSGVVPTTTMQVILRKFKFTQKDISTNLNGLSFYPDGEVKVDTIPDFYYDDKPDTDNYAFFVEETSDTKYRHGYTLINTNISNKDEYNSYIQGALLIKYDYGPGSSSELIASTKVYEICCMFKKSNDISDAFYVGLYGRVFGESWREGFEPDAIIRKPYHLFEHICRLQDYRDICNIPISGWGLQYASSSLVATVGFGSFDDITLETERDYDIAAQVLEYDKGYTDKLKQSLCCEIVLANWQDSDGYERLISLPESKRNPVFTITMDSITDRSSIKVSSLPQTKIYAEPFVNYNKNAATGEYDNQLSIRNTSASVFNSQYVSGFQGDDGIALWNSCHSLALKCHQINKPSDDQTNLQWSNGNFGYTIAYNYLKHFINWQFCDEIELQTHLNIASSWQECTPINILFSHQTNNISRSALVEECIINPNHPYDVLIKAIMYA